MFPRRDLRNFMRLQRLLRLVNGVRWRGLRLQQRPLVLALVALVVVFVLICCCILAVNGARQNSTQIETDQLTATAAGGLSLDPSSDIITTTSIIPFFTTPDLVYPDDNERHARSRIERAILADLNHARQSIDLATYEYNLPSIADALLRAKQRGVTVRLALDRENLDKPAMAQWAGRMEDAEIPIAWEETDAFLHSKFILVDGSILWTGSWNDTVNDTYRNNNNLLRITIPAVIAAYRTEFNQMAEGLFGKVKVKPPHITARSESTSVELFFMPKERAQRRIVELINSAEQRVDFMAFSFTSDSIGDAMIARLHAGVSVRGVMETRNSDGTGSELARLKKNGVEALEDGNCYTMHHKIIIIDDRIVITGSYNFTRRAEEVNDENLVIITDPAIVRAYRQEFDRVFGQASNPRKC